MECKVSVIIPTFRRPFFLTRAINSVLDQTYSNIEVLVVDNNEDKDISNQVKNVIGLFKDDGRVKLLISDIKKNGSAARNFGIRNATGVFIAFLDDDDTFHPTKIAKQVSFLNNNPQYDAVCCEFRRLYKNVVYKINKIPQNLDGNYLIEMLSGEIVLGAGSSLLIKKSILDELNGFDISFQRHQDYEFLLRFFRKYRLGILNERLLDLYSDGIRNFPSAIKFSEIKKHFFQTFEQDIKKLSIEEQNKIFDNHHKEVALYYYADSNYKMAKYHIKQIKDNRDNILSFNMRGIIIQIEKLLPFVTPLKYYLAGVVIYLKKEK